MTTGAGRDSEWFAAAVDNGLSYAGAVPPGEEFLQRDLELVALLRESRASLAPSSDASARMRAQVMAAAANMMPSTTVDWSDSDSETAEVEEDTNVVSITSARGRHRFPRRAAAGAGETPHRHTALGVSAAAALVLLAVTGGGALFSRGALPGDTLYGVKQTTESGLVALTPGGSKAQRQLDVASTRMDEVQQLNASNASAADKGADISQALRGFNEQTTAASHSWLSGPNASNSGALASWANTQSQRLSSMRSSMPASAQPDADNSLRMLEQVRTRANALNSRAGCDTVTSGQSDQFGPIPAKGACSSKDATPQTKQVVPNVPTSERTNAPSLNTQGHGNSPLPSTGTGQLPGTSRATNPAENTPDLHLPSLGGDRNSGGGLLPNRESTSGDSQPGLGGLLGN
ncbi:MAG TPA: DUF5667 domain-containing protein [Pseudonocardia sp.]|jgi:hypothetical protein|nr:DUF5667 domain-containing protein [Pseudonocardia sp.]